MKTLLGALMVLIVSGHAKAITGNLYDSVLLPCNCSQRNMDEFSWQMDEPNVMLLLQYNRTTSEFYGRYKGRAKIYLSENSDNCSVLLTNVKVDDQGKYRCIFRRQETYQRIFVNLSVSARYNVCQTPGKMTANGMIFECDVKGHYRKAEIQWKLDGQCLTNSTTTYITHTYARDALIGLYHFNSKLSTKLNWTSEPTCHVKAKGVSAIISYDCNASSGHKGDPHFFRYRYLTIIPIMLVLGLSLLLWCRCDSSQS